MKNCPGLADLFVRLFARAIISEVPPHPKYENFNTLSQFSLTIAGISLISCAYVPGHK